jgi:hypothetical protein
LRRDSETPKYIETVTGMGYRFVAPVLDRPEADRGAIENKSEARAEANEQQPAPLREILPYAPPLAEQIVMRAQEKDCEPRYQDAPDLRADLQRLMRDTSRSPWDASSPGQEQRDTGEPQPVVPAPAAALVLAIAAARFLSHRVSPVQLPDSKDWEQLTFFTDSAVYPALSFDGRMLAFIRGDDSFMGAGEIYVKLLPGSEPSR